MSGRAKDLPEASRRIQEVCKRVYQNLMLSGYARIDLRLTADGRVYVIEANPNPQLAHDEDFAQSAQNAGLDYGDSSSASSTSASLGAVEPGLKKRQSPRRRERLAIAKTRDSVEPEWTAKFFVRFSFFLSRPPLSR